MDTLITLLQENALIAVLLAVGFHRVSVLLGRLDRRLVKLETKIKYGHELPKADG